MLFLLCRSAAEVGQATRWGSASWPAVISAGRKQATVCTSSLLRGVPIVEGKQEGNAGACSMSSPLLLLPRLCQLYCGVAAAPAPAPPAAAIASAMPPTTSAMVGNLPVSSLEKMGVPP